MDDCFCTEEGYCSQHQKEADDAELLSKLRRSFEDAEESRKAYKKEHDFIEDDKILVAVERPEPPEPLDWDKVLYAAALVGLLARGEDESMSVPAKARQIADLASTHFKKEKSEDELPGTE